MAGNTTLFLLHPLSIFHFISLPYSFCQCSMKKLNKAIKDVTNFGILFLHIDAHTYEYVYTLGQRESPSNSEEKIVFE